MLEIDIEDMRASLGNKSVTVGGKQYEVLSFFCGISVIWDATAMIVAEMFEAMGELS